MKFMILDDDERRHILFKQKFIGHTIDQARTANEAITLLTENKYDIIFLDHDLGEQEMVSSGPGTGYEVAEFIAYNYELFADAEIIIHSYNPAGAKKMQTVLKEHFIDTTYRPGVWLSENTVCEKQRTTPTTSNC